MKHKYCLHGGKSQKTNEEKINEQFTGVRYVNNKPESRKIQQGTKEQTKRCY
jgi:hypothetical protein